jgi:hypothetical protein
MNCVAHSFYMQVNFGCILSFKIKKECDEKNLIDLWVAFFDVLFMYVF